MNEEQKLLGRLRLIEALHAGVATAGEREAAAHAQERTIQFTRGASKSNFLSVKSATAYA